MEAKGQAGHLGTISDPEDLKPKPEWTWYNSKVLTWISNHVDPGIEFS